MANRRFTSQFNYSFERQPVSLMGSASPGSVGAFAALVNNGITWTAVRMGSAGNSITIRLFAGGTAGAEVVSVSGNAISVQIESGVSTRTQVLTAVQASAAASALVGISVSSGGTAATAISATPLAAGADTPFTLVGCIGFSIAQIGTGLYEITLADSYAKLLSASIMLQRSSAVDLMSQMKSADPSISKKLVFRMIAGSSNTNMASGDVLYIRLDLRNSSNPV